MVHWFLISRPYITSKCKWWRFCEAVEYQSGQPSFHVLCLAIDFWWVLSSLVLWLQGVSVGTIKTNANVCCVQFHPDFAHFLAFGSADHHIYYYDLRNLKVPLCTLVGHNKTVSYIKFADTMSLVSASTDNTLKLWDLSMCVYGVIHSPVQSFTGHMNIKVCFLTTVICLYTWKWRR